VTNVDPETTLFKVGLTRYQADVLIALVERDGPADSTTLAVESGVPRTSVYATAETLVSMGLAVTVAGTGAKRWAAHPWPDTCQRLLAHLADRHRERWAAVVDLEESLR